MPETMEDYVRKYAQELGLQWNMTIVSAPLAEIGANAGIWSDAAQRQHTVFVAREWQGRPIESPSSLPVASLPHEFVHAHLAESIDASFARFRFSETPYKAIFPTLCDCVLDVWVEDIIKQRWPSLKQERDTFAQTDGLGAIAKKMWENFLPVVVPYSLGSLNGTAQRHGQQPVDFVAALRGAGFMNTKMGKAQLPLIKKVGGDVIARYERYSLSQYWDRHRQTVYNEPQPDTLCDIPAIAEFLSNVPQLPTECMAAIALYEETVNAFATYVRIPLRAHLVEAGNSREWDVFSR